MAGGLRSPMAYRELIYLISQSITTFYRLIACPAMKHGQAEGFLCERLMRLTFYDLAPVSMLGKINSRDTSFDPKCYTPEENHVQQEVVYMDAGVGAGATQTAYGV